MEKVCTICNENKTLNQFGIHKMMKDGHLNQCKSCKSAYMKTYQKNNKEKISDRSRAYYENNKEEVKERVRTRWRENADSINEKRRERYDNDEEYHRKRLDECMRSNAKCRPERRRKAKENKEPSYYVELCRKRMWHAFNGRGAKSKKTIDLLGCDGHFLKEYLEKTKVEGKDYTNAHIDHIIPCASFDLTDVEQQKKCFHYTNLQLLPAIENIKKSNKIFQTPTCQ